MQRETTAFSRDTTYRLLVEAVRYWVISHWLATQRLPNNGQFWIYGTGQNGIDWGNAPGPDDPDLKPLRGKRIKVTMTIEDHQ